MTVLRVTLFGKLSVQQNGRCLSGFDGRKVRDLFAFLLLRRDKPHPREHLAALLWPDTDQSHAKNYLRKTLWQLQTALEDVAPNLLAADLDWIELRANGRNLWLDVAQLEDVLRRCRDIPGAQLNPACIAQLEKARPLYTGPLLADCYEPWLLQERQRLEQTYLLLLDKLMEHAEASGNHEQGLALGLRALQLDPAREHTHCGLMRLYTSAGKRTEALRQYQRCRSTLQAELGVKPSQQTEQLYQQICQDRLTPSRAATAVPQPLPISPDHTEQAATAELLATMRSLQSLLTQTQQQLQQ